MSDAGVDKLLEEVFSNQPLACRVCQGAAEWQLSPEIARAVDELSLSADHHPVKYEFLCGEHLGPFVTIFADSRVVTWNVTRLP